MGLEAGIEFQSQKLLALPGAQRRSLRRPRETLERNEQFIPKILAPPVAGITNSQSKEHPDLDWQELIKDFPTCIISWTALQASSLLAAMVTSFLAAGPRARTTRAGKSVL